MARPAGNPPLKSYQWKVEKLEATLREILENAARRAAAVPHVRSDARCVRRRLSRLYMIYQDDD